MKLEGLVSQDGKIVVTDATGVQIVHFIHTKTDGSKHIGYEVRALPNKEKLGEYVSLNGAKQAKDKIIQKIKALGSTAFVVVPEDKEALCSARGRYYV